jgi:hypothetical protein
VPLVKYNTFKYNQPYHILDGTNNLIAANSSDENTLYVLNVGINGAVVYTGDKTGGFDFVDVSKSYQDLVYYNASTIWVALEKSGTGVFNTLVFTNSQSDIGVEPNAPLTIALSSSSAVIVDYNTIVRKATMSLNDGTITVDPLPGIQDISPGQPNPAAVRALSTDGGLAYVLAFASKV